MSEGDNQREDIFSKAVRAGKRTYFFDVKTTRGNDLYLTITESKRRYSDDGKHHYEKHKLFLYKEDFDKFVEGLQETVDKITELRSNVEFSQESPMDRIGSDSESEGTETEESEEIKSQSHVGSDISFDDLGKD